ncbi:MAG: hypothetical protein IJU29_00655, partial [Oscillospiraceae bacterium]|nr:hypothetical protein [Oscillospiraceae bacterium]
NVLKYKNSKEALIKSGKSRCRANFRRIKAQKVQEYFVYFKLFATQSRRKFAGRCRRRINQRFQRIIMG